MKSGYSIVAFAKKLGWSNGGSCVENSDGLCVPYPVHYGKYTWEQFFNGLLNCPLIAGQIYFSYDRKAAKVKGKTHYSFAKFSNEHELPGQFAAMCYFRHVNEVDVVIHRDDIPDALWKTNFCDVKKGQVFVTKDKAGSLDARSFNGDRQHPRYQGLNWRCEYTHYIDMGELLAWYGEGGKQICEQADKARLVEKEPFKKRFLETIQQIKNSVTAMSKGKFLTIYVCEETFQVQYEISDKQVSLPEVKTYSSGAHFAVLSIQV